MAKTIKEMAHDHLVAYMHNHEYEGMEDTYMAGANDVLEEIEKEIMRSFLEDFNGMTEHDREIAQGAIAMVKIRIQRLKGE